MKLSKANAKGAVIRDHISRVISNARPNVTYKARCHFRVRPGGVTRVWSIYEGGNGKEKTRVKKVQA